MELQLEDFKSSDYDFHFKIEERAKEFDINIGEKSIRAMNGESVFGPSETWPAQLQDFGYYIAEEVKKDHIKIDESTFTKDNLVGLLQQYKPSLFERTYVSENEVRKTFEQVTPYLEIGIMLGTVENNINNEFNKLPPMKKSFYRTFKKAGRKFIDDLCATKDEVEKTIAFVEEKLPSYARLTVAKYAPLHQKK